MAAYLEDKEGAASGPASVEITRKKERRKIQLIESTNNKYSLTKSFQIIFYTTDSFDRLMKLIKTHLVKGKIIAPDCDFTDKLENSDIECYVHPKSDSLDNLASSDDFTDWDAILDMSDLVIDFVEKEDAIAIVAHTPISFKARGNQNKPVQTKTKTQTQTQTQAPAETQTSNNKTNSPLPTYTTETKQNKQNDDIVVITNNLGKAASKEPEENVAAIPSNFNNGNDSNYNNKFDLAIGNDYLNSFSMPLKVRFWDEKGNFREILQEYSSKTTIFDFKNDISKISKVNYRFESWSMLKCLHNEWNCEKEIGSTQCLCDLIKSQVNSDIIELANENNVLTFCFEQDANNSEPILHRINVKSFNNLTLERLIEQLEMKFQVKL